MTKFLAGLFSVVIAVAAAVGICQVAGNAPEENSYSIEYCLNDDTNAVRNVSGGAHAYLDLTSDKDAYVVDGTALNKVETENLKEYLFQGGVFIIQDENVSYEEVYGVLGEQSVATIGQGDEDKFGYCLNMADGKITVSQIYLGYMTEQKSGDSRKVLNTDDIDRADVVQRIIDSAKNYIALSQSTPLTANNRKLENGYLVNQFVNIGNQTTTLLYADMAQNFLGEYSVEIDAYSIAKIMEENNGIVLGLYDLVGTARVTPASEYYVRYIKQRIYTNADYVTCSLPEAKKETSTWFYGITNCEYYDTLAGDFFENRTWVCRAIAKTVSYDFPRNTPYRYWRWDFDKSVATQRVTSAVTRIQTLDVGRVHTGSIRMEELQMGKTSWFIDQVYDLDNSFRKEVVMNFTYDMSSMSNDVITG